MYKLFGVKDKKIMIVGFFFLFCLFLFSCTNIKERDYRDRIFEDRINRISHKSALQNLGLHIREYYFTHEDEFPDNLGLLWDEKYCRCGRMFICFNVTATEEPQSGNDIRDGKCDYIYLVDSTVKLDKIPPSYPLMASKPGIYADGAIIVLRADGIVVEFSVPPADLKRKIQKRKDNQSSKKDKNTTRSFKKISRLL